MKLIVVRSLLCTSAFVSAVAVQSVAIQDVSDPHRGRLAGVVQDERGQPLAGVTVRATPPGAIAGILPNTRTDTRGRFALAGLLTGHTYLSASKEEAFYPDTWGNFWDAQGSAEVEDSDD